MAYQGDLYDDDDEETVNPCEGLHDSPQKSNSVKSADETIVQNPSEMMQSTMSIPDKQQRRPIGETEEQTQGGIAQGGVLAVEDEAKKHIAEEHEKPVKARIGTDSYDDDNQREELDSGEVQIVQPQTGSGNKTPPSEDSSAISNCDGIDSEGDSESYSFLRPICIAIIAIVIVWVMRMFLPLIQVVVDSELFSVRWWIYLCMLLVPMAAVGYAIWIAAKTFISLPKGVSCRYKDYENQKSKLRTMLIKDYLSGFRRSNWRKTKIGEVAVKSLDSLCLKRNDDGWLNDDDWIEEYKKFQDQLRKKAEEIKELYAKRAARFTVLSQESRLDIVGILFFSSLMILEIAKVFNKRMSRTGAIKTTVFWAMNLYLGGQLQNMGRNASSATAKVVETFTKTLTGVDALANVLSLGTKALLGLGLEYQSNKVLCRMLGEYAIKEFVAVKGL